MNAEEKLQARHDIDVLTGHIAIKQQAVNDLLEELQMTREEASLVGKYFCRDVLDGKSGCHSHVAMYYVISHGKDRTKANWYTCLSVTLTKDESQPKLFVVDTNCQVPVHLLGEEICKKVFWQRFAEFMSRTSVYAEAVVSRHKQGEQV